MQRVNIENFVLLVLRWNRCYTQVFLEEFLGEATWQTSTDRAIVCCTWATASPPFAVSRRVEETLLPRLPCVPPPIKRKRIAQYRRGASYCRTDSRRNSDGISILARILSTSPRTGSQTKPSKLESAIEAASGIALACRRSTVRPMRSWRPPIYFCLTSAFRP